MTRGDDIAEPDPPPYPREFTPEQRLCAYWTSIQLYGTTPRHTSGWYGMLNRANARREHIDGILNQTTIDDVPADVPADDRPPW